MYRRCPGPAQRPAQRAVKTSYCCYGTDGRQLKAVTEPGEMTLTDGDDGKRPGGGKELPWLPCLGVGADPEKHAGRHKRPNIWLVSHAKGVFS
jgi:hypothetical protein